MLVQKLRLQYGWSQQQLAELSGLSVRTIQRIERGMPASTETLKSLASIFEIDFNQLSSEQPDMNSNDTARGLKHSPEEMLAFAHVRKLKAFYKQLMTYVVVIGAMVIANMFYMPHAWAGWKYLPNWWVAWPALIWGFSLLVWASALFDVLPFLGPDWEKRQVEKRLGRPL
ncbi:helix-turn-helix domain-containing protein [Thermomonas sp. HDW16]|nr:helix-turn-helix domain-containing protein [Thermomonas sp. HDW16]